MNAHTIAELHACALATLVSDPGQVTTFERVFAALFGGPVPPGGQLPPDPAISRGDQRSEPLPGARTQGQASGLPDGIRPQLTEAGAGDGADDPPPDEVPGTFRLASAAERLRGRDFAELTDSELRRLVALMREMSLAVPPRRTRRYRRARDGKRPDLRGTLRQARRSGGEAIRLARRAPRSRPRRLVVLCDISGSMEPYARALLMMLYCINGGPVRGGAPGKPEVFSFATRLTRLTPALRAATPDTLLAKAGEAAPDWSGGTRIGAALKDFNDRYGCRGMARGAVVLIISDGWDTGDPEVIRREMQRLSLVAFRIVWMNPRTKSSAYQPLAAGMAAAWPYCDAVVSGHSLQAIDQLAAALADPVRRRAEIRAVVPPAR
jgi:hypothetical protein